MNKGWMRVLVSSNEETEKRLKNRIKQYLVSRTIAACGFCISKKKVFNLKKMFKNLSDVWSRTISRQSNHA